MLVPSREEHRPYCAVRGIEPRTACPYVTLRPATATRPRTALKQVHPDDALASQGYNPHQSRRTMRRNNGGSAKPPSSLAHRNTPGGVLC